MSQEFSLGEPQTTPPAETTASADWLVSAEPSEDASHLLSPLDVPAEKDPRDYAPRPWLEYVLDLVGPEPCPRSRLLCLLDERTLAEVGGPELYGRGVGEETWTFVRAPGVPEAFEELALGWNLAPREEEAPDLRSLRRYRDQVAHRLRPLGRRPRARELPERACERGAELIRLRDNWDVGVALVLRAPWLKRFDSRLIWDAATGLGMRWGHLEIFHWHNQPGCPGDERLFSLWSLEAPGTFQPEHVAAGMSVPEIALGFSVPRSPDPVGVFDRMVTAARYLQSRLGGKLLIGPVAIASEQQIRLWRGRVHTAATELTAAGFPPGSARTMQLF
jgi:cell division protein ZipA